MTSYENGVDFSPAVESPAPLHVARPALISPEALKAFLRSDRIRAIAQRFPAAWPRRILAGFACGLLMGFLISAMFASHSAPPAYINAQEDADDHEDDARAFFRPAGMRPILAMPRKERRSINASMNGREPGTMRDRVIPIAR